MLVEGVCELLPMQKNDLVNSILELTFPKIDRLVRIPGAPPRQAGRRPLTWTLGRLRGDRPLFLVAEPRTDREAASILAPGIDPGATVRF